MKCASILAGPVLHAKALNICKMVEHRQWLSMTPLRQIPSGLPMDLVRRVERKDFPWARLRDLNPQELSELFRHQNLQTNYTMPSTNFPVSNLPPKSSPSAMPFSALNSRSLLILIGMLIFMDPPCHLLYSWRTLIRSKSCSSINSPAQSPVCSSGALRQHHRSIG